MTTRSLRTALLLLGLILRHVQAQEPWNPAELIQPQLLANQLASTARPSPIIVFVGFPALYRGAHIAGAILAGPASKPEGLNSLKKAALALPHNGNIVLYCGCCPFDKCPNVRPAYTLLRSMGFSHVRVVKIETNLHTDWVAKGFPVAKGS